MKVRKARKRRDKEDSSQLLEWKLEAASTEISKYTGRSDGVDQTKRMWSLRNAPSTRDVLCD